MPIEPVAPTFPPQESLERFFRTDPRARVPLAEVAVLLGVTTASVRAMLREEGGEGRGSTMPWSEAAACLFDAWPHGEILDALRPETAGVIPAEFRPIRVQWMLPVFIVRAMEHQAARAWQHDPRVRAALVPNPLHARRIDDYIADLLYAEIEPATLGAFRDDPSFLQAFHYPVVE